MDSTTNQQADMNNPLTVFQDHTEDHQGETSLTRVHITQENVVLFELTPPHAPRIETAEYRTSHHNLVVVNDAPCCVCGVRNSTLSDITKNRYNAKCLETHHYPIERSLQNACDPQKVSSVFPSISNEEALNKFIDSEQNLIVLCDIHHRSVEQGIHHMTAQDFAVLPFLWDHYQVVAKSRDAALAALALDDSIEKQNGLEETKEQ